MAYLSPIIGISDTQSIKYSHKWRKCHIGIDETLTYMTHWHICQLFSVGMQHNVGFDDCDSICKHISDAEEYFTI